MSAVQNQTRPSTPSWPSLYDPLIEFHKLEHHAPIQPGGRYLTHGVDVFRFTFYWTLIFHSLFFVITGGIACFNIVYPSHRGKNETPAASLTRDRESQSALQSHPMIPLTPLASAQSPDPLLYERTEVADAEEQRAPLARKKVHRSRVTYGLFTLLVFLVTAVATSVVESAVVGYVLWAVFQAGKFNVSTWIPPVWALIITTSVVLRAFPSVIYRI